LLERLVRHMRVHATERAQHEADAQHYTQQVDQKTHDSRV
jgi:hypothetical protein